MIKLWRNRPPRKALHKKKNNINLKYIFPSARQAITCGIKQAGLKRESRIAIPEWSSHCVISAVGKQATPIPIREVLKYNVKIDGLLIYEQWGWPFTKGAIEKIRSKFKNCIIIHDMVDSAHYTGASNLLNDNNIIICVASLSKILGVHSGGLVTINGKYLVSEVENKSELLNAIQSRKLEKNEPYTFICDILKHHVKKLPGKAIKWIENNDVMEAIKDEKEKRKANLEIVLKSEFGNRFPKWMQVAAEEDIGPGIVPLLRSETHEKLNHTRNFLLTKYKLETSIYNFNWTGNPFEARYEECLAFPIHGLVKEIEKIFYDINRINNR